MAMQRVAVVVTCGLVGGLAAVFAVIGREQADRVASVVSTLTAAGTGDARATGGGTANSGIVGVDRRSHA